MTPEKSPHICYECDSEFFVFPSYEENHQHISFCPYCGTELDATEEDLDEMEDMDEEDLFDD